jgi:hypothetical protein
MPLPVNLNHTGTFELLYNPYQQAFLTARRARLEDGSRAYNRLVVIAGRRGGKTLIGALSAVEEASIPNTLGWCVAPTYLDLQDYVLPAVFRVLPRSWYDTKHGWSAFNNTLTLFNNSQIAFRSADEPERMRGAGLNWLWIDEGRKVKKIVWDTVAPALTDRRGVCWITTTPNQFDWVYHFFYKFASNPKYQRKGYWAVRYKTIDNPFISQEEIAEQRATTDELWFKQEYEAEFVSFEGAIYGWRVEETVLKTDEEIREWIPTWPEIPRTMPVIVGMDPGADHPFAAVKIIATHRGLLVVDEYSKRMASYADHADHLRHWQAGHNEITFAIDRSARQGQIELAQHGIYAVQAENSQVAGIQRVQAWMRSKRLGIIESRCGLLLEQLRGYHWKDTSNDLGESGRETPFKQDDDLPDALRYGIMTWPELPEGASIALGRDPATVPADCRKAWEREKRCSLINPDADETLVDWERDLIPAYEDGSPQGLDFWS